MIRQSLRLAEALLANSDLDDEARVQQAFRTVLGRPATTSELNRAQFFLADYQNTAGELLAAAASSEDAAPADAAAPQMAVAAKPAGAAPAAGANPDDVDQSAAAIVDEVPQPDDAREAAWAGFVQVLYGSAEFRYLK